MFVLDTNIVSELRRPEKANPRVVAWASATPVADLFLSSITILELELGMLLLARKDPVQAEILRTWLDHQVLPRFEGRILPIDTVVAQCCARLHVPDPRSERDALIAATALVHGMAVATRNVADFAPTGVQTFNPWADIDALAGDIAAHRKDTEAHGAAIICSIRSWIPDQNRFGNDAFRGRGRWRKFTGE